MNRGAQLAMDQAPPDWHNQGRFVAEQKIDGHRVMVWVDGGKVEFQNRNAQPYGHSVPSALRAGFSGMFADGQWLLDGELVDGEYHVFDLLVMGNRDLRAEPWSVRREVLERLFELWTPRPSCIRLVATARTTEAKIALMRRLRDANAEGLVVKRIDAPYRAGKAGTWFKVKFVKTLDARVSELRCNGKDCMALELWDGRRFVYVGNVNMQGKPDFLQGRIQVGDVVEVRYLYAVDSSQPRLVQPEYIRTRDDKAPEQCLLDQLVYTNKAVVAA